MLSISALARQFGLARSTLLHYDHLGLLRPAVRSAAGYRRYGADQAERLHWICTYRRAGLSLDAIARILDAPASSAGKALEKRLKELDQEMEKLQDQQKVVAGLLQRPELLARKALLDKATWVELLRASGLSDEAMDRWHEEFERADPGKHQRFLEALGLSDEEIVSIRTRHWGHSGLGTAHPSGCP